MKVAAAMGIRDKERSGVATRKLESSAGSSLIEVMIGSMILGLVFGGSFSSIGQGFKVVSNSRDYSLSAQILQSEMENLRSMNWVELGALPTISVFAPDFEFGSETLDRFACQRFITLRKTDQKEVSLVVSWKDHRGAFHKKAYLTFITKEGLNDFYYRSF